MNEQSRHTVTAFDEELAALEAMILELGDRASAAMRQAMAALADRDSVAAARVVEKDGAIDALQAKAEALAVNIIALRAPMADDLRTVVAAIKISALLERTADYARNIARRVPEVTAKYPKPLRQTLERMSDEAGTMLTDIVKAYATRDIALAEAVTAHDDIVDALHDELTEGLIQLMIERPDQIGQAAHLLFIGKHIERIGDQATNIAEMVTYAATGRQPPVRDTDGERLAA